MMQNMKEQDQSKSTNIKWHNLTIDREKLEKMRGHKGMVIWFTGYLVLAKVPWPTL